MYVIAVSYKILSLLWKSSALHLFIISLLAPQPLETTGNFILKLCLSQKSCNMKAWNHIVFPHWLLPLRNMHLSFLHTSSWLDDSFLFNPEFWHILYNHGAIIVISRLTIYPSFTKVALFYFWKLIDQDFDFEKFEVYQKTEWKYSEFPSFLTHSPNLPHYYHFLLV